MKPTTFPDALRDRRLSLHIDNRGNITSVSDSPALVFGFRPTSLVGRNLSHVVDVFEGLPETGGVDGMDMQQLLMAFVHRWVRLWLRLQSTDVDGTSSTCSNSLACKGGCSPFERTAWSQLHTTITSQTELCVDDRFRPHAA